MWSPWHGACWQINVNNMIVLRPLNVWRNITKLNQRFNVRVQPSVTVSSYSLLSHARIVCTAPNSDIFRKPFANFNAPHRCLTSSSINCQQNYTDVSQTQKTNLWLQLRQNVDPYARLMRMDRPIGTLPTRYPPTNCLSLISTKTIWFDLILQVHGYCSGHALGA